MPGSPACTKLGLPHSCSAVVNMSTAGAWLFDLTVHAERRGAANINRAFKHASMYLCTAPPKLYSSIPSAYASARSRTTLQKAGVQRKGRLSRRCCRMLKHVAAWRTKHDKAAVVKLSSLEAPACQRPWQLRLTVAVSGRKALVSSLDVSVSSLQAPLVYATMP